MIYKYVYTFIYFVYIYIYIYIYINLSVNAIVRPDYPILGSLKWLRELQYTMRTQRFFDDKILSFLLYL